jgi:hypothetical protein
MNYQKMIVGQRSIKLAEIREMEALLFDNGLALGNRWSGRKGLISY